MSLITLDHDTLDDAIDTNDMLVVDLWASWCGPCKRYSPIFHQVAEETEGVAFGSFQTDASDENESAFAQLGFQAVPTTLFFKAGYLVGAEAGALPKAALRDMITKLAELDVEALHQGAAAQA